MQTATFEYFQDNERDVSFINFVTIGTEQVDHGFSFRLRKFVSVCLVAQIQRSLYEFYVKLYNINKISTHFVTRC